MHSSAHLIDEFWAEEATVEGAWPRRSRGGNAVHVPAAAVLLLMSAMAQPGTLNLNNEVSTEIWEPVRLTFKALGSDLLRQSEGRLVWQR